MNWHDLLGFCVLGALVTTIGSLVAIILKDFFLARSIETWKARQQLRQVYLKLRDPLLLATIDLVNRMIEIAFESPANFLEKSLLNVNPSRMIANTADDQYYLRYKFVSTLYRLCVWFAWVEFYRQDVTFLDSGQQKTNADFESHVEMIRSSFADGHLNDADDWLAWTDSLIFREEQRAIGECLFDDQKRSVIGYGLFNDRFLSGGSSGENRWVTTALNFLSDLKSEPDEGTQDFRRARCLLVVKHGISLIECLNRERLKPRLVEFRLRAEKELLGFQLNSDALLRR
jgi:hypothetical protein